MLRCACTVPGFSLAALEELLATNLQLADAAKQSAFPWKIPRSAFARTSSVLGSSLDTPANQPEEADSCVHKDMSLALSCLCCATAAQSAAFLCVWCIKNRHCNSWVVGRVW